MYKYVCHICTTLLASGFLTGRAEDNSRKKGLHGTKIHGTKKKEEELGGRELPPTREEQYREEQYNLISSAGSSS